MILHIVKKDWKLLWRIVLIVAALQFLSAWMFFNIDHLPSGRNPYGLLLQMVLFVSLLARAVLIVLCVQQDPIPGVSQDWLSRPVKRIDLLLAKLLFVVVLVQGPAFIADLVQALASGFSFPHSLSASLLRSFYYLVMFTLPFLAFGALTRNLTEAIAGGVIAFLLLAGGQMLSVGMSEGRRILSINPTELTGMEWMQDALRMVVLLAVVPVILGLQYKRRKTTVSRGVLVLAGVFCLLVAYLPWNVAFATQKALTPKTDAGRDIAVRFDPAQGRFKKGSGIDTSVLHGLYGDTPDADTLIYLPLEISGLPPNGMLKNDRAEVHLVTADGKVIDLGVSGDFPRLPQAGVSSTYYPVSIRSDLYSRYKDQPVQLKIDYSWTVMRLDETGEMKALQGKAKLSSLGQCQTKLNASETAIEVRCLQAGVAPQCVTAELEDPAKGLQNQTRFSCMPNYAKISVHAFPDGMSRLSFGLQFRDPVHAGGFPVQGKDLPESRVRLNIYLPEDHIRRQLVIANMRMADWLPQ